MPGRVGAAATKSGRFGTTGRAVPGEQDGKVYVRNRCREAASSSTSSNPMDLGWCAVRTHPVVVTSQVASGVGNCQDGGMCRAWQVVVKVYGVATTRPQGQSRAPRPLTEQQ